MQWLVNPLPLIAAGAIVSSIGCAPDVVLARSDSGGGGQSGAGGTAAGTGVSGGGDMPVASAGDGGTDNVVQAPRLLADSVADWSLTQGEHGWQYGYDTGSLDSFTPMTKTATIMEYMPPSHDVWNCWASETAHWTQIFQFGAHPNGTISSKPPTGLLQRAVRRWTSTFAGDVRISGEIAKIDVIVGSNGSNGVDAFVYVDGQQVYATPIGGDDNGGRAYEVVAPVHVGSTVDFVLDPHESDDHNDLSRFTGIVVRVDGP